MKNYFEPISFLNNLFKLNTNEFEKAALSLFRYQFENNLVYREYCNNIGCQINTIKSMQDIPFLPISFFKSHKVISTKFEPQITFSSSGTSTSITSNHHVRDLNIYKQSFQNAFQSFYGHVEDYRIIALLPSYLEREGSSLIYMADQLIQASDSNESGFYLHNLEDLYHTLVQLANTAEKTILIGVSFALLDFVEKYELNENPNLIVMETGGMKGKRKELIREELHSVLKQRFKTTNIHSEYGMTELLSQAYSKGSGRFKSPSWMKVLIRKYDDPFSYASLGETGGINVIDLANIYSCAFIQTDDLGRQNTPSEFEVLGRFDTSDLRGCNLMAI